MCDGQLTFFRAFAASMMHLDTWVEPAEIPGANVLRMSLMTVLKL